MIGTRSVRAAQVADAAVTDDGGVEPTLVGVDADVRDALDRLGPGWSFSISAEADAAARFVVVGPAGTFVLGCVDAAGADVWSDGFALVVGSRRTAAGYLVRRAARLLAEERRAARVIPVLVVAGARSIVYTADAALPLVTSDRLVRWLSQRRTDQLSARPARPRIAAHPERVAPAAVVALAARRHN